MGDGVPVKKRWKIDFSSVCSKNVVSFSKAMKGSTLPSGKSQTDYSAELAKDKQSPVSDLDVEAPKSNEGQNHNRSDADKRKELLGCVEASKTTKEKILGDFSYEKYKPLEGPDGEEEELDYNELDDDMIHRTKFLGIADVAEMETEETSSDDEEDEAEESKEEEEEEDSDREVGGDHADVQENQKEEPLETEEEDRESDEDLSKEVHTEEVSHEEKREIKEEEDMDSEKMEEVPNEESDKSILNTSLCFELEGNEEFKEDISVVDETETSDKANVEEQTSAADTKSEKSHETTAASRVELFKPLSPLRMDETKADEDQNNQFGIKIIDLDLDDPSSPPIVVSKPADMKPIVKTRVTKKKKVMVIQTYNSGSEEEPEVKVRPQRRSKPSMMDLRDQHRIFNTTSFIKETPPEPYHPPPPAVTTASQHGHTSVSVSKEEGTTHARLVTSSSDDAEDSLPLSQFVPKKVSSDKEDTKEDRKLLKKVKKRKLKKKKKDPEEPQKPVSAYALFFRDMQSSIKAEKPDASFGEISKIVANQWDALEGQKKTDYKKKTETAKKEYLKRLAAYKANKISSEPLPAEVTQKPSPVPVTTVPASFVPPSPALSGHLYSIQQSQQHNSPTTKTKTLHSHEEQQRQEPRIPPHHTSSNSRLDFASDGPGQGNYQPAPRIPSISSVLPTKPGICVNEGCTNLAIEDNRWDREYCSTECVVQHCRDAFQSWVMQRQDCFNDSTTAIY